MSAPVPFHRVSFTGRELEHVSAAIRDGAIATDGPYARAVQDLLTGRLGLAQAMLAPSGTDALEAAVHLLGITSGDEVILPSFTFSSTANAVVLAGAVPVFIDVRPDTLNLDPARIEGAITKRTRAIIPVHYAGVACDMDPILAIARQHGLRVIEDAAQAVNAFYRGRPLGGIGDLGAYSFHYTKNFVAGEGGALLVNDPRLAAAAAVFRDKGTNRQEFLEGHVDKYTWVGAGSSGVLGELAAAFLLGQLEAMEEVTRAREVRYRRYVADLAPLAAAGLLQLPVIPPEAQSNYHMLFVLVRSESERRAMLVHLRSAGIGAVFHYIPLHSAPMGRRVGRASSSLAITESAAGRLVRLPLYPDLTDDEQTRVVNAVRDFYATE